jgi:hypothetical protein
MQGDFSLSIGGSAADTDAVKSAIAAFVQGLIAAGGTISSGTFTASESVENLVAANTQSYVPPEAVQ